MATVTKTFTFTTGSDNFSLDSYTGAGIYTFTWLIDEYLQTNYTNDQVAEDFNAYIENSSETWETLGVPANSTITNIELSTIDWATNANADLDTLIYSFDLLDSSKTVTIASLGTAGLPSIDSSTYFFDTFYESAPGAGAQAVGSSYQASNTALVIRFKINYVTLGNAKADLQNWFDNFKFIITYTPPAVTTKYYLIT